MTCVYFITQEHAANLINLMQIASDNNHVFNSKKCQINSTILSKEDRKHDPEEIPGITDMST